MHTSMEQTLDVSAARSCLGSATRKASRAVTSVFDRALAAHGIRIMQFTVLITLHLKGASPLGDLAKFMELDRTTLSRTLELLEAKGWVRSGSVAGDNRSRLLGITDAGRAVMFAAFPAWKSAQDRVAAIVQEHDRSLLAKLAEISPD